MRIDTANDSITVVQVFDTSFRLVYLSINVIIRFATRLLVGHYLYLSISLKKKVRPKETKRGEKKKQNQKVLRSCVRASKFTAHSNNVKK